MLTLAIGRVNVAPRIALPPKQIYIAQWAFGPDAITTLPDGRPGITISLNNLAGPNAILSGFVLYSSNASDPPINPPTLPGPTQDLPRLTPRPASVAGSDGVLRLDLMGQWKFNPSPNATVLASLENADPRVAAATAMARAENWSSIVVPGEYTLQGYRVPSGQPVLYQTQFTAPATWTGLQTKLRCDAIYSNATVYLNGVLVGGHLGGFTPFELDLTSALGTPGTSNVLSIVVIGITVADALASGSQYASHDLGGITRKIYLMAVPPLSIANAHVITTFTDSTYTDGTLFLNISLANDGDSEVGAGALVDAELAYNGVTDASGQLTFGSITSGTVVYSSVNLPVSSPPQWDAEHPRLHNLTLTLTPPGGGSYSEVVVLRVGFREVQIVSTNRIAINGRVIKARGTTRHETHPIVGRSLWTLEPAGQQWARDITLLRDTNINYIRTSHYPPAEELMEAADELGMLIELEMPFCWASGDTGAADFNYTVQAQREAIVYNRNHPSVIHWSLGNESPWIINFADSLRYYLRAIDSTRPFMFDGGSQQPSAYGGVDGLGILFRGTVHLNPFQSPLLIFYPCIIPASTVLRSMRMRLNRRCLVRRVMNL